MKPTPQQIFNAFMAAGTFAGAVACAIAETVEDIQRLRDRFGDLFTKLGEGKDPLDITGEELKAVLRGVAETAVQLLTEET